MGLMVPAKIIPSTLSSPLPGPIVKPQTYHGDTFMGKKRTSSLLCTRTATPTSLYQGHLGRYAHRFPSWGVLLYVSVLFDCKSSSSRHTFCAVNTDNIFTFLINLSPLDCRFFKHRSKTAYLVPLPHILPALKQFNPIHCDCQLSLNLV